MAEEYKIGYSFGVATGEYAGSEVVWLERATGKYPCAGNVTFRKPPELGEHEAAVWNQARGDWDKVADFRGMPWWNADGTFGGVIERLGDDGKITQEPPEKAEGEALEWKKKGWQKKLAEGWIKDKTTNKVRRMTPVERIYAGLEDVPDGCKVENGEIVPLSEEELLEQGKITLAEYNDYIRQQRENEYKRTTDKIGLMVLRGETTKKEWEKAIQAVKDKWPYKEAEE